MERSLALALALALAGDRVQAHSLGLCKHRLYGEIIDTSNQLQEIRDVDVVERQ